MITQENQQIVPANDSKIVIYQTDDGRTNIDVKFEDETVWLSHCYTIQTVGDGALERVYPKGFHHRRQQAVDKAIVEYRKYQAKTLSPVEKAYLETLKQLEKNVRKSNAC